jgi:RNA polymerase sigma-70 factor (ECF subfamily)
MSHIDTRTMGTRDFPSILSELLPNLWSFALRLTRDRDDAEDLVQRACLRALERSAQFRPNTSALSWMYSVVHTTWINEVRSRRVRARRSVEWDDSYLATVSDPTTPDPETNVLMQQIVRIVDQLPEKQRTVMLLVTVEGLSYQEAAQVLGVPVGTVMSRLSRARQSVGSRLDKQEKVEIRETFGV